jgi:hypothetical protein
MNKTISKEDREFTFNLDVTKLPTTREFRELESALAAGTLVHRSAGWKNLPLAVGTEDYVDAVLRSADGRSSGVLKADKEMAEKVLPKLAGKTPEQLAAAGKALRFDGPASQELDALARQFASVRVADEKAKENAIKDLLA